jgi:hypothetical protein
MTDTATPEVRERESGRHPVNVGHLVMGVALLGLVACWALIVGDVVEGDDVRWLLPTPWVLAGAAGLIALAVGGRRGREARQVGWVTPADEPGRADEAVEDTAPLATDAPENPDPTDPTDPTEEETR